MQRNQLTHAHWYHPFYLYLIMILLGVLTGLSGISSLQTLGFILSDIFIRIFKCISTPIISLSLIVTICSYGQKGSMTKVWQKTIVYTLCTTIVAAFVSCLLYLIIQPRNVQTLTENTHLNTVKDISYLQYLNGLIPSNMLTPFLEQQVMSILLIAITIGIAIRYIPDQEAKSAVTNFFKGVYGIFLVITKWVVAILPLGLFGFICTTVAELHKGMNFSGIGEYLLVIVFANLIQGFIILPVWLWLNRINPFFVMQRMLPALSVAFFSKSSTGTLPLTMEMAEKRLGVDSKVVRFVLPLCTSINMNGCAAFIFTTVIYIMQNQGIEISYATMGCWIIVATIAAIGNAGVPMGCFFLSAGLLSSMNVPITLLAIILPFYSLIDMLETALNVWSDSCVVNVVNQHYIKDVKNSSISYEPYPSVHS